MKTNRVIIHFSKIIAVLTLIISLTNCQRDECGYNEQPCNNIKNINISTGVDEFGKPYGVGDIDSQWILSSGPVPTGTKPRVSDYFNGFWQTTPIAATNAQWINAVGTPYPVISGIYTFQRPFTITAGTLSFDYNFAVAYDDALISLKLMRPDNTIIPLSAVVTTPYNLSNPITGTITNPMVGTWKIVAEVEFLDSIGGFLTSGKVDVKLPCN